MLNLSRNSDSDSDNSLTSANLWFHLFRLGLLPLLPPEPRVEQPPPIVIGAHGGSGTRVLTQALRLAGIWMGRWRNPRTEDALATRFFLQRHFEQAIAPRCEQPPEQRAKLEYQFQRMIRAHRFGMPDSTAAWGWKNPRSMWVIPFLAGLYPHMHFIHLVRDGRDLALSNNRNLLRKHGASLLHESGLPDDPVAAQLQLWSLGNRRAAADGKYWLGERYLHVPYEQFCAQARDTLEHLYRHLGYAVTDEQLERGARLVSPPKSIGAWQKTAAKALHEPPAGVADSLRQFGY